MKESDETPTSEARSHSASFLRKAEHMKKSMGGKRANPFSKRPATKVASPMKMGKEGMHK